MNTINTFCVSCATLGATCQALHTHAHIHTHAHAHTRMHTQTHTHKHTRAHTHTHTCMYRSTVHTPHKSQDGSNVSHLPDNDVQHCRLIADSQLGRQDLVDGLALLDGIAHVHLAELLKEAQIGHLQVFAAMLRGRHTHCHKVT